MNRSFQCLLAMSLAFTCLLLWPQTASADAMLQLYAGVTEAPAAASVAFDFTYGIHKEFQWGGNFVVRGGEPTFEVSFAPELRVFLDPFDTIFKIVPDAAIGPVFFQDAQGTFQVGGDIQYGGGLALMSSDGTIQPFLMVGCHGVTRLDIPLTRAFWSIGFGGYIGGGK